MTTPPLPGGTPLQQLKWAEQELAAARAAADPLRIGCALAACAELWNEGDALQRAYTLYAECLPLIRAHGSDEQLAKVLCSMLTSLLHVGQPHMALAYGMEAIDLFLAQGHTLGVASTLINLANVQRELGLQAEALAGLTRAVALLDGRSEPEMLAMTLVNLSVALATGDDFAAAQDKLYAARKLAQRNGLAHLNRNIDGLLELYSQRRLPPGLTPARRSYS